MALHAPSPSASISRFAPRVAGRQSSTVTSGLGDLDHSAFPPRLAVGCLPARLRRCWRERHASRSTHTRGDVSVSIDPPTTLSGRNPGRILLYVHMEEDTVRIFQRDIIARFFAFINTGARDAQRVACAPASCLSVCRPTNPTKKFNGQERGTPGREGVRPKTGIVVIAIQW